MRCIVGFLLCVNALCSVAIAADNEPLTSNDEIRIRMGFGPSALASPEEKRRFEAYYLKQAQAKNSQAEQTIADAKARMQLEKGKLSILIPQAEFWSDLVELRSKHPYGMFDLEIQGAYEAKMQQLTEANKIVREGKNGDVVLQLNNSAEAKHAELGEQLREMEETVRNSQAVQRGSSSTATPQSAPPTRRLRSTDRARMVREVAWAGLADSAADARKLSDAQLQELHREALPILELQQTKRAAEDAKSEARSARQAAERAAQEAQSARQGW